MNHSIVYGAESLEYLIDVNMRKLTIILWFATCVLTCAFYYHEIFFVTKWNLWTATEMHILREYHS